MSISTTVLCGRLTADPELRKTTKTDQVVSKFTLAVDRSYKKENQPSADFFTVTTWNKSAEFLCKYAKKGSNVIVKGRLQNSNYDDKDGKKVYVTELIADEVQIINSQTKNQETDDSGFAAAPDMNNQNIASEEAF